MNDPSDSTDDDDLLPDGLLASCRFLAMCVGAVLIIGAVFYLSVGRGQPASDICRLTLPDQLGTLNFRRVRFPGSAGEYERFGWIGEARGADNGHVVNLPRDMGSVDRRIEVYYFPRHQTFGQCLYLHDHSMNSNEYLIQFPKETWQLLVRERGQLFLADITHCKEVNGWSVSEDENGEVTIDVCGAPAKRVSAAVLERDRARLVGLIDGNSRYLRVTPVDGSPPRGGTMKGDAAN